VHAKSRLSRTILVGVFCLAGALHAVAAESPQASAPAPRQAAARRADGLVARGEIRHVHPLGSLRGAGGRVCGKKISGLGE